MKNLGKILISILLVQLSLLGDMVATVDSNHVQRGEMVTYEIMLDGDNIVRPTITTLCGENVISTGSNTSIQMINGTMTKSYIFTYKFLPQKSCVIEPIEVEIASKIVRTKPVSIKVSEQKMTKDTPFILTLHSSKKEVYVGEPFEMVLLFKQRNDAEAIDSEFIAPTFKGFWIKNESKSQRYKKDGFTITKKAYTIAAQRTGNLTISSAQMRIAFRTHTRDPWAGVISRIKWKSYYSNELSIGVKAIPKGLDLVGDFKIFAEIDKNILKSSEAVNVSIRVLGNGNLEDIKSFKPSIDGVSVFDEKISIVDGVLMQKMAFVSDSDFIIPAFTLKFYNPKTKKIQTIKTKPFKIKVKSTKAKKEPLTVKKALAPVSEASQEGGDIVLSSIYGIVIFLVGIFVGVLLAILRPFSKSKKKKVLDLKDEKLLLVKLLPFKEDKEVLSIVEHLEKNFYSNVKKPLNKKLLKKIIKRYEIS